MDKVICGTQDAQTAEIEWKDFLISSPHLPRIQEEYRDLGQSLALLRLPRIPFISLNADLWLISEELIHAALLQLFVSLLGLAQGNRMCSWVANDYPAINVPLS